MVNPILIGNWVDVIIVCFFLFCVWEGAGRGFLTGFFELVMLVCSFFLSLNVYYYLAQLLIQSFGFPHFLAKTISFVGIAVIIHWVLSPFAEKLYLKIPAKYIKSPLNKSLGVVVLFANCSIVLLFFFYISLGLPIRPDVKEAVARSSLAQIILEKSQELEAEIGGKITGIVRDTYFGLTSEKDSKEIQPLNFTQKDVSVDVLSEKEALQLINQERKKNYLPELKEDDRLTKIARDYATEMFAGGFFSHYTPLGLSPFDRLDNAGVYYFAAGENLALSPTVEISFRELMLSPSHRSNIVSPSFKRVGIGVIDGGVYGKMMVQEFTN